MSLRIGDEAPNFTAETTEGKIDFHQWIGDGWAILFSHPIRRGAAAAGFHPVDGQAQGRHTGKLEAGR
jgi:hypothetical protein